MMEGKIVAEGVLASCYATVDHDLGHIGTTPIRWFPGMTNWIFGENNGSPGYVDVLTDVGTLVRPHTLTEKAETN